jgi:serine/threonine protein kinase
MTGDVVGTLRYMSPEQALAKRVLIDHRTDIYSLGVTLYEVATGVSAFTGENREEVLRKIAVEEPVAPTKIDASFPADLETIILKAASKAPQDRYASAQELADDLRRFLDHKPIAARPPTLVDRTRKWTRRHQAVVWSACAVLVLAVVSLAVSTFFISRSLNAEQQQRSRAEAHLQMAKEAVDDWYVKFADEWLDDQDGLSQEQIEFLQKAAEFYERILGDEGARANFDLVVLAQ